MPHVYVTGHKNPDTDTIASAIGYAEYKNLVDPENRYEAVRLGEVNAQTAWALEKSGAEEPRLIRHVMLRVKDVMSDDVAVAHKNDPLSRVGLTMARRNISQLPIVEDDGSLRFAGASNDWHDVTHEDEAFFLRVYATGDFRFKGADLGILVTKGRMQTAEGLTQRCRSYIDGIRAHYSSEPFDPTPAVTPIAYVK